MHHRLRRWGPIAISALAATSLVATQAPEAAVAAPSTAKHVLLISVDGLHASDLTKCEAQGLCPNLAMLAGDGTTYSDAHTSMPSDSAPGLMALVTGGSPKLTGVFYDDSYDRTMFAPAAQTATSTQDCSGAPGAETMLAENVDVNAPSTANNQTGTRTIMGETIDPTQLPYRLQDGECVPVAPNDFLRTNSIFSVAHQAGLYTAWADKHPVYNLQVAGTGTPDSVSDPFNTEINADLIPSSLVDTRGRTVYFPLPNPDGQGNFFITDSVGNTEAYDQIKVDAILNEIDGWNSAHTAHAPMPAIFGMNFQTVSVAQKLVDPILSCVRSKNAPTCDPSYQPGGYVSGTMQFTPQLAGGIQSVDAALGSMISELQAQHQLAQTKIVVTAKHGQSPIDISTLNLVGSAEQTVLTNAGITPAQVTDDDVSLIWLKDQSQTAAAVTALQNSIGNGNPARIQTIYSGSTLRDMFGDPTQDPRTPDIIIQPIPGTIYSHSKAKVAEHGGFADDDTHVAMIVFNGGHLAAHGQHASVVSSAVTTSQVAPTILKTLGLNPAALDAVQSQGTQVLPGQ